MGGWSPHQNHWSPLQTPPCHGNSAPAAIQVEMETKLQSNAEQQLASPGRVSAPALSLPHRVAHETQLSRLCTSLPCCQWCPLPCSTLRAFKGIRKRR